MNRSTLILALFGAALGLAAAGHPLRGGEWPEARGAAPAALIFDTDMDTDCDDAGALAVLHALADAGEAEILATMVSSRHAWSAPCVAAINAYYGRGALPIGCPKGQGAPDLGSRYARQIAQEFPTALKSNADAPDAARLYRKILAARRDGEVVVVTVGDLTNLRDLLATGPDEHSPLAGPELVRRKVKAWVCMGGRYPRHLDPAVFGNFKPDPASSVEAVAKWPTTIYFSGLGDDLLTGEPLRATPQGNPVRRAYELYLGKKPARPSWDLIATLFAVRGCEPLFQLHRKGHNHIFPNGTNEWRDAPDKNHVLIQLAPGAADRLRATLNELMTCAPRASAGRAYLFTFFREPNGNDGLHLAWSRDGYRWEELGPPGHTWIQSTLAGKCMRDPSLQQGPDGTFHLVWTTGWGDKGFGYASSKDLIAWSRPVFIPVMEKIAGTRNTWAPELFYDAKNARWLVIWSSTVEGRFPETADDGDHNHRLYYATTKDFSTFSEAKLFCDPGFNCIDGTLLEHEGKYYLILKNEPPGRKHLQICVADSAEGPWGKPSEPLPKPGKMVEGPSAIRIGEEFLLYFDVYSNGRYGALQSRDLKHWEDITPRVSFPPKFRHGTVLEVSEAVLQALLSAAFPVQKAPVSVE